MIVRGTAEEVAANREGRLAASQQLRLQQLPLPAL